MAAGTDAVVSEAPPFWWKDKGDLRAWLLWPFAALYAAAARHRLNTAVRAKVDAPVLCIGNLTVGGAGKTPVAIAMARAAAQMNLRPGFLSRGHGGSVGEPHQVDPDHDSARHVGDEPLLLARVAPTVVTADRAAGAAMLIALGCDFIIMDDGFQSARLRMDYALLVVDSRRGVGNGHVIPAGPLRARIVDQMPFADGVLAIGDGGAAASVIRQAARAGRAVFSAALRPIAPDALPGTRCLVFAGIGDPARVFDTVRHLGAEVVQTRSFGDHHVYTSHDIEDLIASADANGLSLVTTAKDAARLRHGGGRTGELLDRLMIVDVEVEFELASTARAIISQALNGWHRRRIEPA
jgi:tetraacyldisaccharide 4'-kinase